MSQSGDGELKLAVAVGRKVALLRWKHPVVWSTWTVGNIKDVADGFEIIKVSFKLFQWEYLSSVAGTEFNPPLPLLLFLSSSSPTWSFVA